MLGRPCCDIFVGRDVSGNRLCYSGCHVLTLVEMGEPVQHFGLAAQRRDGKPIWLDVSILVVPGSRKDPRTTVHLFRVITGSSVSEARLREGIDRSPAVPLAPAGVSASLTRRETEILELMAGGGSTKAMAAGLNLSSRTVRNHVQNILSKLGAHSRLEAVTRGVAHGLIRLPPASPPKPGPARREGGSSPESWCGPDRRRA